MAHRGGAAASACQPQLGRAPRGGDEVARRERAAAPASGPQHGDGCSRLAGAAWDPSSDGRRRHSSNARASAVALARQQLHQRRGVSARPPRHRVLSTATEAPGSLARHGLPAATAAGATAATPAPPPSPSLGSSCTSAAVCLKPQNLSPSLIHAATTPTSTSVSLARPLLQRSPSRTSIGVDSLQEQDAFKKLNFEIATIQYAYRVPLFVKTKVCIFLDVGMFQCLIVNSKPAAWLQNVLGCDCNCDQLGC